MDQKFYPVIGTALVVALCGLAIAIAAGWMVYSPDDYSLRIERFNIWLIVVSLSGTLMLIGGGVRKSGWRESGIGLAVSAPKPADIIWDNSCLWSVVFTGGFDLAFF